MTPTGSHRIAVLSDTHIPDTLRSLPQSLIERLRGVDRILHAGDVTTSEILDQLEALAPTTAVAGNMDPPAMRGLLKDREIFESGGFTVGLVHGHQRHRLQNQYIASGYEDPAFELFYRAMASQLAGAQIIVFGHFHQPLVRRWRGILFVNPGSIAPPHARPTFAQLDLGVEATAQIVELPSTH